MVIKNDCRIVARVRQELHASTTRERYRVAPGDFSRQPILTLPRVATLILRGHKVSQQNALNKFFRELNQPGIILTGSADCQARQKLKPELFVHLNAGVIEEFTALSQADQTWRTWRGHRLLGADGSKLNLPDTAELRAAYSLIGNQHGTASERVQGLAVTLYDLLNDIGLAAHLGPLADEPKALLERLAGLTRANDLLAARASSRPAKARPQINRAVSYVSLLDHAVALPANPELPLEEVVEQLHRLFQTNPKYNAPGRQFARPPRSPSRSLQNQRYRKRITS